MKRNTIDFKLIRFQMAAMCLRQHQEYQKGLINAKIDYAWFERDKYLYVKYIVPVVEHGETKFSRRTFRYLISPEDGTIQDVSMIRTCSYDVVNPDEIEY